MQPAVIRNQDTVIKNVLLVEDDAIVRQIAAAMLKKAGCAVTIAKNGQEALELSGQPWHLVLMDCQMPILDGREATRLWRQGEARHTPIVALTAETETSEHHLCLAAGMDDVLSKPLTAAKVEHVLERWATEVEESPEIQESEMAGDISLLESYRGYENILRAMIEAFLEALPAELATLSAQHTDSHEMVRIAHKLKGQAKTFGASAMAHSAAHLQSMAQNGIVCCDSIVELQNEATKFATQLRLLLPHLAAK